MRQAAPQIPIYVSTSTIAGRRAASRQLATVCDGWFYAPFDYVSCVRRVIRKLRPAMLVVVETEIWPNLYSEVKRSGARLIVVNGRISDRTWSRYRTLTWFFRPVLQLADTIFPQSGTDRQRYEHLGVTASKMLVEGNFKYDATPAPAPIDVRTFGSNHIWIAASTVGPNERGSLWAHEVDEDEIVIRAFQSLASEFPDLLLILAPRQPARFDVVARKLENAHVRFERRSAGAGRSPELQLPGVLLLDTIGELAHLYALANVVFVGGSIAPRGGHNILEPAAAGVPIVVGPYMQNFAAVAEDFRTAGALVEVQSEDELLPAVRNLLDDPRAAGDLGSRARSVVRAKQGTAERITSHLWRFYYAASLRPVHGFVSQLFLQLLANIWVRGGVWKRQGALQQSYTRQRLRAPVISVGGITVGGSGKTPFVIYLARALADRGYSPAILTRGYRRRSLSRDLVLGPAVQAPPNTTGDEAQILLRSAGCPIGIGADRREVGSMLLNAFASTDVLLLDDGFQHARLARDVDIVLLDGLDPW
jgi:3-deoxy-D-manno-octulosonic-acid transferase